MFDENIVKIEKRAGEMYLHEGEYDPIQKECTVIDLLHQFPTALVSNDNDKKAILTHLSCSDAVGYMHDLVRYILQGSFFAINTLEFQLTFRRHLFQIPRVKGQAKQPQISAPTCKRK